MIVGREKMFVDMISVVMRRFRIAPDPVQICFA